MTVLPIAEARANLSSLVEDAARTHERFDITRNGRRAAVLMSADDYDSLMETLDILSDKETLAQVSEAETQMEAGEIYDYKQVRDAMTAHGRLE